MSILRDSIMSFLDKQEDRTTDKMIPAIMYVVNDIRYSLKKSPVKKKDIEAIDSLAYGHSDYTIKIAFYAEKLILQD